MFDMFKQFTYFYGEIHFLDNSESGLQFSSDNLQETLLNYLRGLVELIIDRKSAMNKPPLIIKILLEFVLAYKPKIEAIILRDPSWAFFDKLLKLAEVQEREFDSVLENFLVQMATDFEAAFKRDNINDEYQLSSFVKFIYKELESFTREKCFLSLVPENGFSRLFSVISKENLIKLGMTESFANDFMTGFNNDLEIIKKGQLATRELKFSKESYSCSRLSDEQMEKKIKLSLYYLMHDYLANSVSKSDPVLRPKKSKAIILLSKWINENSIIKNNEAHLSFARTCLDGVVDAFLNKEMLVDDRNESKKNQQSMTAAVLPGHSIFTTLLHVVLPPTPDDSTTRQVQGPKSGVKSFVK